MAIKIKQILEVSEPLIVVYLREEAKGNIDENGDVYAQTNLFKTNLLALIEKGNSTYVTPLEFRGGKTVLSEEQELYLGVLTEEQDRKFFDLQTLFKKAKEL